MSKIAQISFKMKNQYQRDLLFCAATLVGEARSEGYEGMQAVMNVIKNRLKSPVKWWHRENDGVPDDTLAAVCVDAWQFSCWNDGTKKGQKEDPNYKKCVLYSDPDNFAENLKDKYFARALSVVSLALNNDLKDLTSGSTHYYANYIAAPAWAKGKKPVIVIGRHKFFNNIS
jgi:spore germination cell wall hydrolase CwlJ-like protein